MTCKRCDDRGWVRKGSRIVEWPACLGRVKVANLTPEQRKA